MIRLLFAIVLTAGFGGVPLRAEEDATNAGKEAVTRYRLSYYIDSVSGDDQTDGRSAKTAWKTLARLQETVLKPGDAVRFKRGSHYTGPLYVNQSGTEEQHITLTDYGDPGNHAPKFTSSGLGRGNFGNCIRIRGSHVIVEHLYFHGTPTLPRGKARWLGRPPGGGWSVWDAGAIVTETSATHCIVRNNEFEDCVYGIRSNARHALIEDNYIHDCNRFLSSPNWGPLGIGLGNDHQTVVGNTIKNMIVIGGSYGADGGAIEIDDGRHDKTHTILTRNYSYGNLGFLECIVNDAEGFGLPEPTYENWQITHNVCDDYQVFLKLRHAKHCHVSNNTILRRKVCVNEFGVFELKGNDTGNEFHNNIIYTKDDGTNTVGKIFENRRHSWDPNPIVDSNHYFCVDSDGTVNTGRADTNTGDASPGPNATYGDVHFVNIDGTKPLDFRILSTSPARDTGIQLNHSEDFTGNPIPFGDKPDRGAFEYHP